MKFENLYRIMINEGDAIEDLQELDTDITTDKTPEQMSDDEKIDYLVNNSNALQRGKDGVELSPTEKVAKAKSAIDNGFFDDFYEAIQSRKQKDEMEDEEIVPSMEELPDLPALGYHRKEQEQQRLDDEEFGGQDI